MPVKFTAITSSGFRPVSLYYPTIKVIENTNNCNPINPALVMGL
jgi:hypothetical protein